MAVLKTLQTQDFRSHSNVLRKTDIGLKILTLGLITYHRLKWPQIDVQVYLRMLTLGLSYPDLLRNPVLLNWFMFTVLAFWPQA